jgi:hypothetical protein
LATIGAEKLRRRRNSRESSGSTGASFHEDEGHEPEDAGSRRQGDHRGRRAQIPGAPEGEHQTGDSDREHRSSCQIEAHPLAGRLAQHQRGEQQSAEGEEGLDHEHDAPSQPVHQRSAGNQPKGRRRRAGHRPPSHCAHTILRVEGAEDEGHRGGLGRAPHHRGQGAQADQGKGPPGEGRRDGRNGRGGGADQEDTTVPVEVAELPEQGERHRGEEHRRGDHPRHRGLARVELEGDRAERDGQDGDREGRREHARQGRDQHPGGVGPSGLEPRREAVAKAGLRGRDRRGE